MHKNLRPYVAAIFTVMILLSEFTSYTMSEELMTVIGAVIGIFFIGRTVEKKAVEKTMNALKALQKARTDG
ncbi:MAG: hypothetical protein V3T23_01770 [Nitrososphaerales archaeon]